MSFFMFLQRIPNKNVLKAHGQTSIWLWPLVLTSTCFLLWRSLALGLVLGCKNELRALPPYQTLTDRIGCDRALLTWKQDPRLWFHLVCCFEGILCDIKLSTVMLKQLTIHEFLYVSSKNTKQKGTKDSWTNCFFFNVTFSLHRFPWLPSDFDRWC